jgi:hypothetical protein
VWLRGCRGSLRNALFDIPGAVAEDLILRLQDERIEPASVINRPLGLTADL